MSTKGKNSEKVNAEPVEVQNVTESEPVEVQNVTESTPTPANLDFGKSAINVTVRAKLEGFGFSLPLISDDNGIFAREVFRKVGTRLDEFQGDSIVIEYTAGNGVFTGKANVTPDVWVYTDSRGEFTQERAAWQSRKNAKGEVVKIHDRGLELARVLNTISTRVFPKPPTSEKTPGVRSRINALTLAIAEALESENYAEAKRLNAELRELTTPANKDANA